MANLAAQPTPPMCICIGWQDDRGAFNHIHYMDMQPSDVPKILNRKHEKEITARSTYMTITYTAEPCLMQSKGNSLAKEA